MKIRRLIDIKFCCFFPSGSDVPDPEKEKQTPFQSCLPTNDVRYSLRHVEESWIHLLKAGVWLAAESLMTVDGIFTIFFFFSFFRG